MIYTVDKSIKEYYTIAQAKHPDIPFEHFEKICKSPFYYIKKKMEDMSFPLIHIKYLGKFLVYSGKVKALLNSLNKAKDLGTIAPVEYEQSTIALKNYLENERDN